jgi:hypothetical protein
MLMEEEQEVLYIPDIDLFGNWNALQQYLKRKGNPLYSIGGNLNLYETQIESLGNLTSVGNYLNLSSTPIKSLGNLTSVGGDLYLRETQIKSIGNLQSVGGSLDLMETQISKKYTEEEIRQMIDDKGEIYM